MEDLRIIHEAPAEIQTNFDEFRANLTEYASKYEGIVVTEDTLQSCKADQKELAGVRTKIDTYRKTKKKELSEPITAFENQCKDLIALIEEVEKPIKAGIEIFDNQKRAEKKATAERLIAEVIEEMELNEKYGVQLTVIEKYGNLTTKESDVKADLTNRAMVLKTEQDREAELLEIIKDGIDSENKRLNSKLTFESFQRLINSGASTKDILAEIKARAESIYAAEHPAPKEEPKEEPKVEVVQQAEMPTQSSEPFCEAPKMCFATVRLSGTLDELKSVLTYMKANNITYKVLDQGEI